ncbi:TIGR02302 family protein [Methylosinus sp. 3S-1]|uniref:TIGR02302 family protein n=2 Tax=Methylocystaceae TaxID=31993 RepID=A0A2D2D6A2_METT3|nr:TIGR02302 family protein [Methylosinus trichosporium OB3b]OBS52492.1 TIGR02302 family protein [Methylosinus sp. 3S-1]
MNFARKRDPSRPQASPALERLVRRALAALALERGARVAAALLTLLLFFLALSFSGVWRELGPSLRMAGVAAFVAAAAWVLLREALRGPPRRAQAMARLDAAPGAEHRLASSLEDSLAGAHDAPTRALWDLHRRRLEHKLTSLAPPRPEPGLPRFDPLALRAAALVAAIAAAFVAGPERMPRLLAAFDWDSAGADGGARIDAWLDPPAYTGRSPVVLPRGGARVAAPIHSTLVVRSFGGRGVAAAGAGLTPLPQRPARPGASESEETFKLDGEATLSLRGGGSFDLSVIPDRPPTIALVDPPRGSARGSLTLSYRTDDDYGVAAAEATAALPPAAGRPPRSLYPPPRLPLALPPSPAGLGEAKATVDVSDHPWAGARVLLSLVAHDEGGNQGVSEPVETVLPQRRFTQPLARALAEQRRNIALDPDHASRALVALDALKLGAALFETPSAIYLGVDSAKNRLERARDDDDLREAADLLWAMALSLEEGDAGEAERELRAAQQELREALARGAGEEEIARLTEQLRSAMQAFLNSLAKSDKQAPPQAMDHDAQSRAIGEDELQSMLNEIEKAERAGDLAEAQRLLDELQNVLENLQPAQAGRPDPRAQAMGHALDEIDKLTREQQQLRDETSHGAEQKSAKGRPSAEAETRGRQRALRDRLEKEQERLRRSGEPAPQDFADAEQAMKEAEQALGAPGEGRGRAVDAQGRALQALRRGADQLAERMQGEGEGEEGPSRGRRAGLGQGEDSDPLGRPSGRRRAQDSRARLDPLGLPPAVRARRVQEELRRRLGQPERPADELDYFERLLKR